MNVAAACILWFFAVSVWEPEMLKEGAPYRWMGGWAFDGPHESKALCETARREREIPSRKIMARYVAGPCRSLGFREYINESTAMSINADDKMLSKKWLPMTPPFGVRLR